MTGVFRQDENFKPADGGFDESNNAVTQEMVDHDSDGIGSKYISIMDFAGRQAMATVFGELQTGGRISDISVQFQYNISTTEVVTSVANGGSASASGGLAVVSTGTNATGSGSIQSFDTIRYRPGHQGYALFTARFTEGVANSIQWAGPHNLNNGFAIGFNGTSFGIKRIKGGVETFTAREDWTLDKLDGTGASSFVLDYTKLNIFLITYGYLGVAPVIFFVYGGFGKGWIPFHVIDVVNQSTVTHINQPMLPIKFVVRKTSGSSDVSIATGSWDGGTVGHQDPKSSERHFATANSKTISPSTLTNILTIKNQSSFQGLDNLVNIQLVSIGFACDGTKTTQIKIIRNATLGGSPSYSDIDATNSVVQIDTAGTTVTGGRLQSTINLSKAGQVFDKINESNIHIHPGETLTFAAYSTAASDIDASTRWVELF